MHSRTKNGQTMNVNEPIISIDWLQIHVDASDFNCDHKDYNCTLMPVRSRTFSEVWSISKDGRHVAILQRKPFSPKIPKGCGTLKIENFILYYQTRQHIVEQFLHELHLSPRGTTRIDICGDFQKIANRWPEELIRDIIEERIYKVGHARSTLIGEHRIPSGEFTTYGTAGKTNTYSYLRYGSRTSRISTYLYNKSKELREQHDKPYIREMWKRANFNEQNDTWRLEFSLKGRNMDFIYKDTGEELPHHPIEWLMIEKTNRIYTALCEHYFDIREKTQIRKDREHTIPLFDTLTPSGILVTKLDTNSHNNRADKIFIRKLAEMANETQNKAIINAAALLGQAYAKEKDLRKWASEQGISFKTVDNDLFTNDIITPWNN